jgi:hypothetical protein
MEATMSEQRSYFDYYNRLIDQQVNGLKYVLGGTGLGKTSSICQVIASSKAERKFIYCANRIQLLDEMAIHCDKDSSIRYVHLQSDQNIVTNLLQTHKSEFYDLLRSKLTKKYIKRINDKVPLMPLDIARILQASQEIESCLDFKNTDLELISGALRDRARIIINCFKRILSEARGNNPEEKPADYQQFIQQPVIKDLFPYITFKEDPTIKLLLVTIQKAFQGFFDGRRTVSLSNLHGTNGNYIIFLDEFDFLESNLIELICADTEIHDPFQFVEYFYRAMKRHKLPLDSYPVSGHIRDRITKITNEIDLLHESGLKYPDINQFTCSTPELKRQAIFQTNRIITNRNLYLHETARSFDIVSDKEQGADSHIPALRLFRNISIASNAILFLFKDVEVENPIVYREMLRHCFDGTVFINQIKRIRHLPRRSHSQSTQFDHLLDSGFSLYEIQDLQQETDKDEVVFRHYAIHTTPEKILLNLACHNLVFGLSATADLPRCVRNFSDEWLYKQDKLIFHEIDHNDIAIIEELNRKKQSERNNQIHVIEANELDTEDPLQQELGIFIDGIADEEGFGGNDNRGYRKQRVQRFFATLLWIAQHRPSEQQAIDTHLLFFTSYRQIEYIFTQHQIPNDDLFIIQHIPASSNKVFESFEIAIADTTFIVIFYNAKKGQQINSEAEAKEHYYNLFWQQKPVIVITTYPSAGNGVNLQYFPTSEKLQKTDFLCVHLLDSPYFFFGRVEDTNTIQQNAAIIKQNIWYQAKLFESKIISESMFKSHLSNIRNAELSSRYLSDQSTSRDSRINLLATYIQALGRIERVWTPISDQTIRLSHDIYQTFEVFSTSEAYADLYLARERINSSNLAQVFVQIRAQAKANERKLDQVRDERLANINQRSQDAIKYLLKELAEFRKGSGNSVPKTEWQSVRKAVLKHDMHSKRLKDFHCIFQTNYSKNGILLLDRKLNIYPPDISPSDCINWDIDRVYRELRKNEIVRQHFERNGYELGFTTSSGYLFTPYCYQAILTGAIGEEAISALLKQERIQLEELPDQLFEIADHKIAGVPWYIDCKYYSERTLDAFQLSPDDPAWQHKLNEEDFKQNAKRKLEYIRQYHHYNVNHCKLLYINLFSANDRSRHYLDAKLNAVGDFASAQIIVIQGALMQHQPNDFTDAFQTLLHHIKTERFKYNDEVSHHA